MKLAFRYADVVDPAAASPAAASPAAASPAAGGSAAGSIVGTTDTSPAVGLVVGSASYVVAPVIEHEDWFDKLASNISPNSKAQKNVEKTDSERSNVAPRITGIQTDYKLQ